MSVETSGKLLPQNLHSTTLPCSHLMPPLLPPPEVPLVPPAELEAATAAAATAANSISIGVASPSGGSRLSPSMEERDEAAAAAATAAAAAEKCCVGDARSAGCGCGGGGRRLDRWLGCSRCGVSRYLSVSSECDNM